MAQGPTPEDARIEELDVARGVAILGILVVNMMLFAHPVYVGIVGPPGEGPVDAAARILIAFFFEGKFYTLFSLLFGIGMALQWRRARGREAIFVARWKRRSWILLAIGAVHVLALWWGDILILYALLGFVLLPFRHVPPRRLLVWAVALLLVPLVLQALGLAITEVARSTPEGAREHARALAATRADWLEAYHDAVETYRGGDFVAMVAQRVRDWTVSALGALADGFLSIVFAMFVLGVWVGRSGVLRSIDAHLPAFARTARWAAGVGVVANAGYVVLSEGLVDAPAGEVLPLARMAFYVVGAPALSLAYACGIVLLTRRPGARRRLRAVAAVGRTALSNYLLQSVVVTTLVYGYGLGLYGRIGPAAGLALSAAIFSLQLPLSVVWLRAFRFGPVEWLWRSLTYGHTPPMGRRGGG